ncbi:response regulator [Methylophilus aquaticus]|uniref:Response regulator transcription factor n=1 Tax=Methylophilus aquaticus TaxID=1971610 RepID=A0ABT9JVD8_9PROT|nr:response regulator transcription factor [Methylophilus aquaticus]MDP8568522.1 response regulator transcription factor [Methylophilus aquaticus]
MKTAFILEDTPESHVWLSEVLQMSFPDIAIISAHNIAQAISLVAASAPLDIALIDLSLPDGSGITVIEWFNRHSPHTICVVASIFDDDNHIFPALRAGAHGYLLKDQPQAAIVQALNGIVTGQPPLSPAIARKMLRHFHAPYNVPTRELLTEREKEVLSIIAKGMTMAETANMLGLKRNTIAGYVKEIYRKLNVSSRAEAAISAQQMGLI